MVGKKNNIEIQNKKSKIYYTIQVTQVKETRDRLKRLQTGWNHRLLHTTIFTYVGVLPNTCV